MSSFEKLQHFINTTMRMSHIYQPVFIRELLKGNGSTTVNNIAKSFLSYDKSQQEYYEYITKTMPSRILKKHGLISKEGNVYSLNDEYSNLSVEDSKQLINLCDAKIDDFLTKRSDTFNHRRMNSASLPGSLRYEILKRSGGRCEACGISSDERAIDIDHIVPKNKGGSNDRSNLQALCYKCNRQKRDTDDTDFASVKASYTERDTSCVFCNLESNNIKVIAENELALVFYDGFAVTQYHTLIIPKRHVADYFDLHTPEVNAIQELLHQQKYMLQAKDKSITGFNVGINCGEDAGQSIFHVHVHLIPRRKGDMVNPKGGVRGVIPEKQKY